MILRSKPKSLKIELAEVMGMRHDMSIRKWYKIYVKTKYWKELRKRVLLRDGFACVQCKSQALLHVDHLHYDSIGKEELSDLQTLCYRCHALKTRSYDLNANKIVGERVVSAQNGTQLFSLLRSVRK